MEEKGEVGEHGNWRGAGRWEKRIRGLEGEVEMEWPRKRGEEREVGWRNGHEYRRRSWRRRVAVMYMRDWAGVESRLMTSDIGG